MALKGWRGSDSRSSTVSEGFCVPDCFLRDSAVTPDSIDPFTYVSLDPVQRLKASFSTAIIGSKLGVRCLLSTEALNDVEADMPLAAVDEDTATPVAPSVLPNGLASAPSKPRPSGPKVAFPPSHMPELLRLIEGNTKIRTDLVSQLKAHFDVVTSKAAIEAKIKEVASRQGKAKDSQWRVRPEAWVSLGAFATTQFANRSSRLLLGCLRPTGKS